MFSVLKGRVRVRHIPYILAEIARRRRKGRRRKREKEEDEASGAVKEDRWQRCRL